MRIYPMAFRQIDPDNVTDVYFENQDDYHLRVPMLVDVIPYGISIVPQIAARRPPSSSGAWDTDMFVSVVSDPKLPKAVGELKRRSVAEYLGGRDLPEPPYRVEL